MNITFEIFAVAIKYFCWCDFIAYLSDKFWAFSSILIVEKKVYKKISSLKKSIFQGEHDERCWLGIQKTLSSLVLTWCILLAAMLRCHHLFWSRLLLTFHYFFLLKRIEHFTLYVCQTTFIYHHLLLLLNVYSVNVFAVNLPRIS